MCVFKPVSPEMHSGSIFDWGLPWQQGGAGGRVMGPDVPCTWLRDVLEVSGGEGYRAQRMVRYEVVKKKVLTLALEKPNTFSPLGLPTG